MIVYHAVWYLISKILPSFHFRINFRLFLTRIIGLHANFKWCINCSSFGKFHIADAIIDSSEFWALMPESIWILRQRFTLDYMVRVALGLGLQKEKRRTQWESPSWPFPVILTNAKSNWTSISMSCTRLGGSARGAANSTKDESRSPRTFGGRLFRKD